MQSAKRITLVHIVLSVVYIVISVFNLLLVNFCLFHIFTVLIVYVSSSSS
jgi:hypothetical protein